jgi:hypothetical protein
MFYDHACASRKQNVLLHLPQIRVSARIEEPAKLNRDVPLRAHSGLARSIFVKEMISEVMTSFADSVGRLLRAFVTEFSILVKGCFQLILVPK